MPVGVNRGSIGDTVWLLNTGPVHGELKVGILDPPPVEHLGERHPDIRHPSRAEKNDTLGRSQTLDTQPETLPCNQHSIQAEQRVGIPRRPVQYTTPTIDPPLLKLDPVLIPHLRHPLPYTIMKMNQKCPPHGVKHLEVEEATQTDNSGVANSAQEDPMEGGVEYSTQPTTEGSGAEDSALGDRRLLTRVMGQPPTSLRLHFIRDAGDVLILHEIQATDSEAEQLKARATLYPTGSRVWRLLREEARSLQQHGALSRVWLSNRVEPPGPHIRTPGSSETENTNQ